MIAQDPNDLDIRAYGDSLMSDLELMCVCRSGTLDFVLKDAETINFSALLGNFDDGGFHQRFCANLAEKREFQAADPTDRTTGAEFIQVLPGKPQADWGWAQIDPCGLLYTAGNFIGSPDNETVSSHQDHECCEIAKSHHSRRELVHLLVWSWHSEYVSQKKLGPSTKQRLLCRRCRGADSALTFSLWPAQSHRSCCQDNFFVTECGSFLICCVADGHGPGHSDASTNNSEGTYRK